MTDEDKDARIAQLEEALHICSSLWNSEVAARSRVEEQYIALAQKLILKTKGAE
jgi:hypothetical protein